MWIGVGTQTSPPSFWKLGGNVRVIKRHFLGEVACEETLSGWGGHGICKGAVKLETCGAR